MQLPKFIKEKILLKPPNYVAQLNMNCSMDFMLNWRENFVKGEALRDMILLMQRTMSYPIMSPLLFKPIRV